MGERLGLVVETMTRPAPKPVPRRVHSGPPPAIQVIPRPRCPVCKSRSVWVHRTEGNLRHYHCRAGCVMPDGEVFRFKVMMV